MGSAYRPRLRGDRRRIDSRRHESSTGSGSENGGSRPDSNARDGSGGVSPIHAGGTSGRVRPPAARGGPHDPKMKVLLVGNLAEDRQESMRRFTDLLDAGLRRRGHETTQVAPTLRVARLVRPYRYGGLPKYLGYVDKFLLFPRTLRRHIARHRPDVVHITDHSNAVYLSATRGRPTLVTCHDLLQIRAARGEIPQQRVGAFGRQYQAWILRHLARAPRIACVSAKTRVDAARLTGLPSDRISVVPNSLNYPYAPLTASVARERIALLARAAGI